MGQEIGDALNVTAHCLDRHAQSDSHKAAIIWQSTSEDDTQTITYGELSDEVNRLANGLKTLGVTRGDTITVYMPVIPETIMAILACTRIGASHSQANIDLPADALASHIETHHSLIVITANMRYGEHNINLKDQADKAINLVEKSSHIHHAIVVDLDPDTAHAQDVDFYELTAAQSDFCEADSELSEQCSKQEAPSNTIYEALSQGKTILIQEQAITTN